MMDASKHSARVVVDSSEYPAMAKISNPIELLVTNLDQRSEQYEMKKIVGNLFREHVSVLNVSVFVQSDGNVAAIVKVGSKNEAQFAISQLHKRKIGHKRISISYKEQVDTLIQQTNSILLSVEEKYTNLSNQIMSQGKIPPPPPQISVDNASIKKLETNVSGLETKFDFLLKNLESALTSEDDDIRRQLDHKYEDIAIQLNASSSRQAVSEVRMDVLEQLVLDIAQDKDQATTEDPLFGHDFSMLKAVTPGLLETTQRSVGQTGLMENRNNEDNIFGLQNSPSNHNNFKPQQDRSSGRSFFDAQQQDFERKQAELLGFAPIQQSPIQQQIPIQQQSPIQQRPIQQRPFQEIPFQQRPFQESPNQQRPFKQSPVQQSLIQQQSRGGRTLFEEPTQPNMSQDSALQCQCSELQLKVGKLEGELSSLRKEMEGALGGLQETMTVLQHKIQEVELVARGEGPAPCVATKEAANMAGMDVWCMQNCAKGNCPPNLCTCPPKR